MVFVISSPPCLAVLAYHDEVGSYWVALRLLLVGTCQIPVVNLLRNGVMSILCVTRHGSLVFVLVCHAQVALPDRYQQGHMFVSLIWLSFHIVQVMAPGEYCLMHSSVWYVSLPGVVCWVHPLDFLGVHL